jgi:hypothetical protein
MTRDCVFTGNSCTVCGAPRINARQVCGSWRPGLGDRIASGLSAIGITKERAQAVAQAVGLDDCGCGQRQAALNEFGYRLGIGTPPPAESATPAAQ